MIPRRGQILAVPSLVATAAPSAVPVLWAAYITLLPFHRLWRLPWFDQKLQPPEIVFIGLVIASAVVVRRYGLQWRPTFADAAVAAWVGANVLAFVLAESPHNKEAVIETLGAAYLAALYAAVRITATPRMLDRFGEWFAYSAVIAAALGITGVVASWLGYRTPLATVFVIPYFGLAARAQAFTANPGMLASIITMAIPLFLGGRLGRAWRRRDAALLLVLVLGLVTTVAKTALCLAAALGVMWACRRWESDGGVPRLSRVRLWTAAAISLGITVAMAVGSHVMVMHQSDVETMSAAQLVGGRPVASFDWHHDSWVLMPTTYTFNNHASLLAIARTWPLGVGLAGQPAFTARLKDEGRFPPSIWMTTPHSTYLGTAAERGAFGFAALAALLIVAGITIRRLFANPMQSRWEAASYAGAGVAFLIEALSSDLLNCRHYWLLLAVVVARRATASRAS
jgi:hypothetical protein